MLSFFIKSVVSILLCAILGACSSSHEPIKVGTNVWPGYALYYLAQDQGYIPTNNIRLIEYQNATFVSEAFINGDLDGAMLTLDEALRLRELGVEFTIIQVIDVSRGADAVMSRRPIADIDGFVGKTIAVERSAVGALMLAAFEDYFEIPPETLQVIDSSVEKSLEAYKKGIDFIITFVPFSEYVANAGGFQIFDTSLRPNLVVDVLVVKNQIMDSAHRASLEKLISGFFKANELLNSDPDTAVSFLQKRLQLNADEVKQSFRSLDIANLAQNRGMLSGSNAGLKYILQDIHEILTAAGYLSQSMPSRSLYSDEYLPRGP